MREQLSRRRVLGGIAATAAGSTALYVSTSQSSAQVDIQLGDLTIPNVSHSTGGDEIESADLEVQANYEYESSHEPDEFTLQLLIGDAETTLEPIDEITQTDSLSKTASGSETLSGAITETYHFATETLEPSGESEESTAVYVGLSFTLRKDGETIAEQELVEPVTITVDGKELDATASIGGTGEITIE